MVYRILADAIVVFHFGYVSFVVFGLIAILLGVVLGWRWVRNFWFRAVHFLMIAVVVFEALIGFECPLTTWERELRTAAGQSAEDGSFIGRLAHDLLFYDAPEWVFTICYCLFGAAVLLTLILAPPRRPNWPARFPRFHLPGFRRSGFLA